MIATGVIAPEGGIRMAAVRLDALIARFANVSRKAARALIVNGEVSVEGVARPTANMAINGQRVHLHGVPVTLPTHRYYMLHKPAGLVSSTTDGDGLSVLARLPVALRRDLHLVGRLDRDTTGLLLLTTDGQWSHRISAPRSHCRKVYRVEAESPLTALMVAQLERGVQLRGEREPCLPAQVEQLDQRQLRLTLQEGRYHQVKRMLAAVGNHVVALHREQIGALKLDAQLAPGEFRALTTAEVASLR